MKGDFDLTYDPRKGSSLNPQRPLNELTQLKPTIKDSRQAALDEVAGIICNDRAKSYGPVEDNFANITAGWNWWLRMRGLLADGKELTTADQAAMMAILKLARLGPNVSHRDSVVDLVGYGGCWLAMIIDREQKS